MDEAYRDTAHLFSRAGFGGLHSEIEHFKNRPWTEKVDLVLDTSRAPALAAGPNLADHIDWYERWVAMTYYWLDRARRPVNQAPIQEKMTLFWHGLLCSSLEKTGNHQAMFDQVQLFRKRGLGSFEDLIWQTSVSPAMLLYLDNFRNIAGEVNENFSRELMELFMVGVGHYTETDVREAARAWTGHGLDWDRKRYVYNSAAHDGGRKTFLGQTGRWGGRDIIRLILSQRRDAHARFMCSKLWSFFAYPVGPNDGVVADIAVTYKKSFNIKATLRSIFMHPQFRSQRAFAGLVRSPTEYVVALMRHSGLDCATAHPEWHMRSMGQYLFHPPNVSGWGQNSYWITESAVWAKVEMASNARWTVEPRAQLNGLGDVVSWNPVTYAYTAPQVVDRIISHYQLPIRSSASRQRLINYVRAERGTDSPWAHKSGVLMLALLLPEMQMA